ncbi:MlaD family protein [Shewanella salipaludis]|uniref:MCE family protein n=1 Tax=Shewanella salipaludis TaxID=2723052 RepID=A0A972FQC4_9GAMM|nr:MlaD family protein [Shewanella salipaludis]NMH64203.1 MCE family protein [Shewanella salipaludis]
MTQIESPKIVKKKLFSPIWLLPILALALGAWLGIKSIRESGIEIQIHFPSATGIDIGKTLVRYQGLTVGKVIDIAIDEDLKGVDVKALIDYRSERFLNEGTLFWLVTPKASITGVEGLDALFSGNYIAMQPGGGGSRTSYEAQREPPAMQPGSEGVIIELKADKLGSLDVGSPVFYRQVPVGSIVSYRLEGSQRILISAFIQEQFTHLVKKDSHFWNVSGVQIDASLAGVKVTTESLASILAGGISFDSNEQGLEAENGDSFPLYDSREQADGGQMLTLTAIDANGINKGTGIFYRGVAIGEVRDIQPQKDGVRLTASMNPEYGSLLTRDAHFWLEGADLSLNGVSHAERLLTGKVINFLPGVADAAIPANPEYPLANEAPELAQAQKRLLKVNADENAGIQPGADVRYKQIKIGSVLSVNLSKDFSVVEYQLEILPEFVGLVHSDSYLLPESALAIEASLDGVSVKSRDLATLVKGAVSLLPGKSHRPLAAAATLKLFASAAEAEQFFANQTLTHLTLVSQDGADLAKGSPVYYKKMQIGLVEAVNWQADSDTFQIRLALEQAFAALVKPNTVFWRNNAVEINASLAGLEVAVAPLKGALKGSISLGLLAEEVKADSQRLYESKTLAQAQAQAISLTFPASARLASGAAIRYRGHKVGEIQQIKLNADLQTLTANAYLYGEYADYFSRQDSEYFLVDAQISLAGIKAVDTLITGPYVGVTPGNSANSSQTFAASMSSTAYANLDSSALTFTLEDTNLGSIRIGTPLFFRGIAIGQIDGYTLSATGNRVLMLAHVEGKYKHLVNNSSKFWNVSGIKVDVGLFSGAQIETGSLESILVGGISVATREPTSSANALVQGSILPLHASAEKSWRDWQTAN